MSTIQTWEQARHTRKLVRRDSFLGHITDFIATHAARADGLAAHLVRMGPGQCHVPASAHAHGGRLHVVTQRSVALDGIVAPHLAVAFVGLVVQSTLVARPPS